MADNYGTALLGLHHRADIHQDSTVMVTAAAGGLGLAAVDVAVNVYRAKVRNTVYKLSILNPCK